MDTASSGQSKFLSLPLKLRNDIYRKVLIVAHPLYLFQDSGSEKVELFAPDARARWWLALLYTNRQIHAEASAVLYGLNQFTFMDTTRKQANLIQTFVDRIGPVNAGYLSHLCINFPLVEGRPGSLLVEENDLRGLTLLREKCTNLTTLETLVHGKNSMGMTRKDRDSDGSQFIQEALTLVNRQIRSIPSLEKIIIRFYDGSPTGDVMELIQGLGWVILSGR